ncbi:alpha-amylase family glycosyl hydrolase [Anaeromicropila herbilytica]|uniref:Maltodextrin glucosidase n=1 Tax=Anaeromicropila herbilytica TaxID=2785025 RepID=A0A7R7EQ10_9FIRM|nr:alpha-amylase family glycosyl hydrolase [Anaeromicropila herbilytica]BCN32955.1 maltodextrin glucosidase [Anaeromicropila herbilytica]
MSYWYEKANFYHIYPFGLCGVIPKKNEESTNNQFTILEQWIPHIKNIGCNALYIGPLFESILHGYDTTDYKLVDARLGTNENFMDYVRHCHENNIKVVVDGVFNHTGREFFAFLDIKERREQSKYLNWYKGINLGGDSPYHDGFSYEGWRGHYDLVQFNLQNKEVRDYLFEVVKFWIDEFDIDGIRLDCADVLDFNFMKELRSVCNSLKEEFWLMGEVIHGDYSRWVNDNMLHSVTNYELHKGLYSGHNDHNYFEIAHTVKRLFDPKGGLCKEHLLYTFLDNHDVERIHNKLKQIEHIYPIMILVYTLPGIPSVYYGSEWLIEGKKEKDSDDSLRPEIKLENYCSRVMNRELNKEEIIYHPEHERLIHWIQKLAQIRLNYDELAYGIYMEVVLTNRQYAYARLLQHSAIIVAVNNDDNNTKMTLKLPIKANKIIDLIEQEEVIAENNMVELTLEKNSGRILWISEELEQNA